MLSMQATIIWCFVSLFALGMAKPIRWDGFLEWNSNEQSQSVVDQAQQKIARILADRDLSWRQRYKEVDRIYESLPPEAFVQLPLGLSFDQLPEGIYQQINTVFSNKNLNVHERRNRIRQILETLYWEQRILMLKNNFPLKPPSGFEEVLGSETYAKLLQIHQTPLLSIDQKKMAIDKVMSKVPKEVVEKLPLFDLFAKLPENMQQDIRRIMYNFQVDWDLRASQLRQYIRTLPKVYRRMIRGDINTEAGHPTKPTGISDPDIKMTSLALEKVTKPIVA